MSKQNKRKRQEEQRKYLQRWSKSDLTESAMIHFKTHPEEQMPYRKRMSKYALKKFFRDIDKDEKPENENSERRKKKYF